MSTKHKNKRVGTCLIFAATCIILAVFWSFAIPETALAKKPVKPGRVVKGDVQFLIHEGFGIEIDGYASEVAESHYRAIFSDGSVIVTLPDGTILDQHAFIMRFTNSITGERYLAFRVTLQDGHKVKDRYSTPGEDIGDPALAIPFPETTVDPGDGSPWLEVVEGSVDENLDMLPGAHVILHFHVDNVPLINIGSGGGGVIGTISVGDIEFTMPE